MAYLRKSVSSVTGVVTTSDIGLKLNTPAIGNLAGTISTQQIQLADAFTLTGDLTVNDDLFLGKVQDDGTGQSIDGAGKTITGTGSITMGSAVAQTSVSGMSGVLDSAVTGGVGLFTSSNLASATFPTGHVVKSVGANYTTAALVTCYNVWADTGLTATLADGTSGNDVYVHASLCCSSTNIGGNTVHFRLMRDTTKLGGVGAATTDTNTRQNVMVGGYHADTNDNRMFNAGFVFKDTLSASGDFVYKVQAYTNGNYQVTINRSGGDSTANYGVRGVCTLLINEVQT